METIKPFVAVWMITYNHEKYIAQAIEGVMMQQTDFAVKLFIGDDGSTDNTASICKSFQTQYPNCIELILHDPNIGAMQNAKSVYEACFASGANYIAMCEGDDYWTDAHKLQKQVTLLEANPQYALCFHEAVLLNESTGEQSTYISYSEERYNTEAILKIGTFIPTVSIVFRTKGIQFPDWYFHISIGDIALILMTSLHGDIVPICEKMGVYRKHDNGMSQQLDANQIELALASIKLLNYFNMYTKFAYDSTIQAANTAALYRLKHHEHYKNTRDTRGLLQKISSPDFWQRKAKEIKGRAQSKSNKKG